MAIKFKRTKYVAECESFAVISAGSLLKYI